MQAADEVAPTMLDHVPALQLRHTPVEVAALTGEYVPGGQLLHVLDDALDHDPAAQLTQEAADVAPWEGEYVPAEHSVHVALDVAWTALDHVPALQSVHTMAVEAVTSWVTYCPAPHVGLVEVHAPPTT